MVVDLILFRVPSCVVKNKTLGFILYGVEGNVNLVSLLRLGPRVPRVPSPHVITIIIKTQSKP